MKHAMKFAGAFAGSVVLMPALMLAAATPAVADSGSALSVTVTGLHSTKGKLVACLWREKEDFPICDKSPGARRVVVPVSAATMNLSFPSVAPGQYAVAIYHDEDGDGKMKRSFIGMPQEGVAISNNPDGRPNYDKSLIKVESGSDAPSRAITMKMKYL